MKTSSSWCVRQASRRRGVHANGRAACRENHDNLDSTGSIAARCSSPDVAGGQQVRASAASDASGAGDRARAAEAAARAQKRADGNHARTGATTKVSPRRRRRRRLARSNDERHHSLLEWPPWGGPARSSELIISQPMRAVVRNVGLAHDELDRSPSTGNGFVPRAVENPARHDERDSSARSCHLSLAASDKSPSGAARRACPPVDRRERKRVIRQAAANFVVAVDENNDHRNYGCQASADTKRHAREEEEAGRRRRRRRRRRRHTGLELTTRRRPAGPHELQNPERPPERHLPGGGELVARRGFVISIISEQGERARQQKSSTVVGRARDVINRARLNYGARDRKTGGAKRASGQSGKALISRGGGGGSRWLALCALLALASLSSSPAPQISQPTTTSGHFNFLAFNLKSVHCATSAPPPSEPSKFAFWLGLERALFEGSGAPAEAVAQLARTLAEWPDQRQAALFYLEQVAGGPTGAACPSAGARPVSLAQLMQPAGQWPPPAQRVALDDLGAAGGSGQQLELNEYLTGNHSQAARLAQLAVDSANLIGRLLALGEQREDELNGSAQDRDPTSDGEDARTTETPNFLSKLFRLRRRTTAAAAGENPPPRVSTDDELARLEMVLRRLVTPKFMNYLLEFKAREWLASGANDKRLLHSLGMVMFNDDGTELAGPIWFGSLAVVGRGGRNHAERGRAPFENRPSVTLIQNLYARELNSSLGPKSAGAHLGNHLPSYLAKWWLETPAAGGVGSGRGQLELEREDGGWFSPQLECGHAPQAEQPRWLLTYAIPIYSHASTRAPLGRARLRGVSFVSLDLARMGPLISQCTTPADDESAPNHRHPSNRRVPSFLAGTHHCQRIRSSQCVPLPEYYTALQANQDGDYEGEPAPLVRPGTYVCKCPTSWPQVARAERESTRAHREQLIELLDSRAALNSSLYALDQLAIERVTASLQGQQDGRAGDGGQQQHDRRRPPQGQPLGETRATTTTTTRVTGAFELTNKAAIARLLLLTRATAPSRESAGHGEPPGQGAAGASASASAHQAGNATGTPTTRRAAASGVGHFTLGVQLEAEAALDWFARSGDTRSPGATWPEEACQRCGADQAVSAADDYDEVAAAAAAAASSRAVQSARACRRPALTSDSEVASGPLASIARGGRALAARWLRPLVLCAQLACVVLALVLAGCLARIRKSRAIALSGGWLMLATMLLGALLLYSSVLARYSQATSLTCLLEPWLRELGFSTFYGSILIKLYRILTEFQTRKAHRVCLRDKDQVVYLLAIVLIVVGYMSAWTALMVDGFFVRSDQGDHAAAAAAAASPGPGGFEPEIGGTLDIPDARLAVRSAAGASLGALTERPDGARRTTRLESQFGDHFAASPEVGLAITHLGSGEGDENKAKMRQITTGTISIKRRDTATPGGGGSSAAENLLNEHLEILERGLNSFGELFLGLLESEPKFEPQSDTFVYLIRCRKLAWDYVTESSEIALLLFGVHLIYKLRNASSEVHKEKLILSLAVFIELVVSSAVYLVRHALWHSLTSDHLLVMYFARCQLTVTLTVILVFAPKLRQVCRNKPGSLFGPSKFSALLRGGGGGGGADNATGPGAGCHAHTGGSGGGGGASSSSRTAGGRGASARHRCHISCELHDHHLNDASRLQQAMLSNLSALEIGTINLADMDPDEIQAELKRVYTQLELLKTKVMRRDNPHISKRRGGRKPGHRKFSLQAFHHGRHNSGGGEQHSSMESRSGAVDSQAPSHEPSAPRPAPGPSRARLPALTELEGESPSSACARAAGEVSQRTGGAARPSGQQAAKHVRVDESLNSQQDDESSSYAAAAAAAAEPSAPIKQLKKYRQLLFSGNRGSKSTATSNSNSSSTARASRNDSNSTLVSTQTTGGGCGDTGRKQNKWAPEMPSTSSLGGYLDDDVLMMTMNDSQSSGELTPQHRSSLVHSQASFQQAQSQQHHRHLTSQPSASTSTADHLD